MAGYFSRIAKQTGLRFSQPAAKKRQPTMSETAGKDPLPIEVDETKMVAPSQPDQSMRTGRERPRAQTTAASRIRTDASEQLSSAERQVVRKEPHLNDPTGKLQEKRKEIIETDSITLGPSETLKPTGVQPGSGLRVEANLVEAAASHDTITPADETAVERTLKRREPASSEVRVVGDTSDQEITRDATGKGYFIKTAEIIERGDADPAEIRHVLLREVQEWAAGSTAEAAGSDTVKKEAEPQIAKQVVRPLPERTDLIGENIRNERAETEGLAEQVFELSIGTINVVIEDEKPKQPEPAPRATTQNAAKPASREFSRLSRRYL